MPLRQTRLDDLWHFRDAVASEAGLRTEPPRPGIHAETEGDALEFDANPLVRRPSRQPATRMSFLLTNSSAASSPISRAVPERFTPPKGSSGESASTMLT